MSRVHFFQHVPFEGPAALLPWFRGRGHACRLTHVYAEPITVMPEDLDLLVILGGPMSVHDEKTLPWLSAEKDFLHCCIASGKAALGVCLGAQMLAEVLGGEVKKNPEKEIGFFAVQPESAAGKRIFGDAPFTAFHWHGETFSIPEGAEHIASSATCAHQAFLWERRVLGLQFHLETTAESMEALIANCAGECWDGGASVQSPEIMRTQADLAGLGSHMDRVLDRWLCVSLV